MKKRAAENKTVVLLANRSVSKAWKIKIKLQCIKLNLLYFCRYVSY